jgi:hypothetical protein
MIKKILLTGILLFLTWNIQAESKQPEGEYQNWRLISIAHREDNKTLRAILGNHVAISSARAAQTKPWQDGTILAKVIWKESRHEQWGQAFVPGEFSAAEAMIKDSKKFTQSGGWGFGHWVNGKLEMHDAETSAKCFACHMVVQDNDYVFHHNAIQ